ncbi:hypothetical protein SAMN04487787_101631 [Kosakonia sacchari]|nr:hypothetical protein SAMN04487787_101631 [Kosakonia sacchari]
MNYKTDKGDQEIVTSVTLKDLADFIVAKKASSGKFMACPFCGHDSWSIQPDLKNNQKPIILMMPVLGNNAASMWFFPFSCTNCGHNINFNAKTVADTIAIMRGK